MSRDQAMLDLAEQTGQTFLRLYTWSPHALSFGRHEAALRRYDRSAIERLGLDVVRRPTGGRAVWHGEELTYAVAAPVTRFGSLALAYRDIHELLRAALARLDLTVTLAERRQVPGLSGGACFSGSVGGEIVVGGRKLVGSAQLQQGNAFLQHGSILLGGSQNPVSWVTRDQAPETAETSLSFLLGRPIAVEEASRLIVAEFAGVAGEPAWLDSAARVHEPRFRSEEWTWRR